MEKKTIIKEVVERTVLEYHYSKEDVEELIVADLKSKGYKPNEVKFKTDYKYVSDEWGMNAHPATVFKGAVIEVEN